MPIFNPDELSTQIREEALRLGFFKVGMAPVSALPDGERFAQWLRDGMNGEIRYLERQVSKRLDPRLVLEGARSFLILALSYYSKTNVADSPSKGRISRYAWGDDYHKIVRTRLEAMLAFIKNLQPSVRGRCYTDTGPVMEKVWGARTSVGWMGKHTILISREHGSWFFIGVILLDAELEYDTEEKDFCGQCDRCIQSCPSGAITAPYVLDASRCISYLTQQHGPIPRALRPVMGNRIFGCDACQDACPWNRFARETSEPGFHARKGNLLPELVSLVGMSSEEFSARFINSPIGAATRNGFVRNVVVALGNSRSERTIPALKNALRDVSPLVRGHAAWALGRIANASVRRILESARDEEADPLVREELSLALAGQV